MTSRIRIFKICFLTCLSLSLGLPSKAQSTSAGSIVGSVRDPSAAIIPGAIVELINSGIGFHQNTLADGSGTYRFQQVPPADYQVKVTAAGFQPLLMTVKVNVAESTQANVTLTVGQVSQAVEVNSTAASVALQTTNSTVGDVLQHQEIDSLPTSQREITEIVYLQPATTPISGGPEGSVGGGSVAGGRVDQNSLTLDGIIVTDQAEGGYLVNGTIASFGIPEDAIQEFRGVVSNPSEDQARSGGGQFAMTTRRGGNDWHGTVYDYYKNAALNANTWTRNRLKQPLPGLISNRYGGSFSGAALKNKTFFFLDFEGYRFPQSQDAVRNGPSQVLKNGVVQFRNSAGQVVSYNFNPANGPLASVCGPSGNLSCDPRGIGFNPLIKQYLNTFYPVANDPSSGDGLNTAGIRAGVSTPIKTDFGLFRVDHNINSKWRLFTDLVDEQIHIADAVQLDFNPAATGGSLLKSTSGTPQYPILAVVGLTGSITPNFIYDFRFGYNQQGFNFARQFPSTLLPTAGESIQLAYGYLDQPGNSTRNILGPEASLDKSLQFNNQATWVKNGHVVGAGLMYQHINEYHYRTTEGGATGVPVAQITAGQTVTLPAAYRPPTCSATSSANCLPSGSVAEWNSLYGMLLGVWDNTRTYNARTPTGQVLGPTTPLAYDQTSEHFELTASDVWQLKPSLVLSYGFNMTFETPYRDLNGKDYLIINSSTGQLIDPKDVIQQKQQAALSGQVYNVPMSFVHPAQLGGRSLYPSVFNFGPRAGLAWNPAYKGGLLGKVLGDRKTVLRGGYALVHDQILGIQTELYGVLGNQLLATANTVQAATCDASGTPGPGCVAGSSPYRIGIDGPAYEPAASPFTIPFSPGSRNVINGTPFGVTTAYGFDPNFRPGSIHSFNATLQRQLPGDSMVEVGWIGRFGRTLSTSMNVNTPPVVALKDLTGKSSQTFAQAFDGVANQLRKGVASANVTAQPWFENVFGPGGTTAVAAAGSSSLINAEANGLIQNVVDPMLQRAGRPTIENQQFGQLTFQTDLGRMNYNAGFVSFRKRTSHGLTLIFNYTLSHCLDSGLAQSDGLGGTLNSPYNPSFYYGSCITDVRQAAQIFGRYDLPSPAHASPLVRRVLGGWSTSYIFTASTGLPLKVYAGDAFGSAPSGAGTGYDTAVAIGPVPKVSANYNVAGSSGIGTAGNPATGGTGVNLFANPAAVFANLRPIQLSTDTRASRGLFNGLGAWNADISLAKQTALTERVNLKFAADFFNVFNHVNFLTPTASLYSPTSFGVVTADNSANAGQNVGLGPRRIQASLRIEF